jgi:hypothetical protein
MEFLYKIFRLVLVWMGPSLVQHKDISESRSIIFFCPVSGESWFQILYADPK